MKRVLVTGGCGFIGSHLVDRLLAAGRQVVVLDDLSTGTLENLAPGVKLVRGCVTERATVMRALDGVESVIHLAAVSSVQASVENPARTHQVNFDGTLNVLEACRSAGVSKVIYTSTAAVYGNPASLPVSETCCPAPMTPYAIDKLASEYYLSFYRQTFGFDTTIFRLFNVFGPRQDPSSPYSGVISLFVNRALTDQPIRVFGDGSQTRDFVYVGDVVSAIVAALGRSAPDDIAVNVGTGSKQSLQDIIAALQSLTGKKLEVRREPPRPGDIKHSCADVTRLKATGWRPKTGLLDGLRRIIGESRSL